MKARNLKRLFEKRLRPDRVTEALAQKDIHALPEKRSLHFIIIHVDEAKEQEVFGTIRMVVETFIANSANVSEVSSSIIVGVLDLRQLKAGSAERRLGLVSALLQQNGTVIHIAHGECDGWVGLLGAEGSWHYGAYIPNFSNILRRLFDTPFGASIEVH